MQVNRDVMLFSASAKRMEAWFAVVFAFCLYQWTWLYLSSWRRASKKNTWKVSLLHSTVTFIGSVIVIWVQTPGIEWWQIMNDDSKTSIVLVLWSMCYFLCDLVAGCLEDGTTVYTWHHLLVLWSYSISLYCGHSIKGLMYHLFYSEMGNICYGARAVGIFGAGLEQGLGDGIFLLVNRVAWFIHLAFIGLAVMLEKNFRVWDLHDYCAFYGSVLLMLGDALFAVSLCRDVIKQLKNRREGTKKSSAASDGIAKSKSRKSVMGACVHIYKALRQD